MPENVWRTRTAGLRQSIILRFATRYSLKVFSRSWSSSRIASGVLKCWIFSANGFFERSVPVWLAYSAKASMISWRLGLGVVVWPVDDMKTMGSESGENGIKGTQTRTREEWQIRRLCKAVHSAFSGEGDESWMHECVNLRVNLQTAIIDC